MGKEVTSAGNKTYKLFHFVTGCSHRKSDLPVIFIAGRSDFQCLNYSQSAGQVLSGRDKLCSSSSQRFVVHMKYVAAKQNLTDSSKGEGTGRPLPPFCGKQV